jgi:hypothetical protein
MYTKPAKIIDTGIPFEATHTAQQGDIPVQRVYLTDSGVYSLVPVVGEKFRAPLFVTDTGKVIYPTASNRMIPIVGSVQYVTVSKNIDPSQYVDVANSPELHAINAQRHAEKGTQMVPAVITEDGPIPLSELINAVTVRKEPENTVWLTPQVAYAVLHACLWPDPSMPATYCETQRGDSADLMPQRGPNGERIVRVCVRNTAAGRTDMHFIKLPSEFEFELADPVGAESNELCRA